MNDIHPATPQLLDLAAEMRPDWDIGDLSGALASAKVNGWPFAKACLAAVRLLCKPGSEARELLAEVANPVEPKVPVAGDVYERGAALARSELARTLIEADLEKDDAA